MALGGHRSLYLCPPSSQTSVMSGAFSQSIPNRSVPLFFNRGGGGSLLVLSAVFVCACVLGAAFGMDSAHDPLAREPDP